MSLTYKGYLARVEFDVDDRLFFGRLSGIADIVTFHGESVDEAVQAFEEAVDGYLAMSEQLGRAPQTTVQAS
jgi:predicted HicB family RNase H-like nuclease